MVDPHRFIENPDVPPDHNGDRPCICGRGEPNRAHDEKAVAEVDAAQAEHRRRIGEDQDQ